MKETTGIVWLKALFKVWVLAILLVVWAWFVCQVAIPFASDVLVG